MVFSDVSPYKRDNYIVFLKFISVLNILFVYFSGEINVT